MVNQIHILLMLKRMQIIKNKKRKLNNYIEILTYIWLKWIDNHTISNDINYSIKKRRYAGERCEKLQRIRQRIIVEINKNFNEKIR